MHVAETITDVPFRGGGTMNFLRILSVFVLMCAVISCRDSGMSPSATPSATPGSLTLNLGTTPAGITKVVATLSRQGFPEHVLDMTVGDSSASGSFDDVPVGTWHLKVNALDATQMVRYTGESDVEVASGMTSTISLQMVPANGRIVIVATWGGSQQHTDPFLNFPLDGNATDASGNGNNGSVSSVETVPDRFGTANSAMLFDGMRSSISVPSSPSMHPRTQLTVAFWIRVDSMTNNYSPIFHKGGVVQSGLSNREYAGYIKMSYLDHFQFQIFAAGDGMAQHEVLSDGDIPLHQWVFVAAVFDRIQHVAMIYVNDALRGQSTDSYSTFNANNSPLTLGTEAEHTFFDHAPLKGAVDDFRLYGRALSPTELHALYVAR